MKLISDMKLLRLILTDLSTFIRFYLLLQAQLEEKRNYIDFNFI